jgi:hypothetical protein
MFQKIILPPLEPRIPLRIWQFSDLGNIGVDVKSLKRQDLAELAEERFRLQTSVNTILNIWVP